MDKGTKQMYSMFLLMAGAVQAFLVYYYAYPMWAALGLRGALTDSLMLSVHRSGTLASPLASRLVCLFFTTVSVVVRSGNSKPSGWAEICLPLFTGLALYFGSAWMGSGVWFVLTFTTGFILFLIGAILLGRTVRSFDTKLPDFWDTFPQCEKLIENESKLLEDHRKANKEILTRHFYDMSNMMSRNEGVWLSNGWVKTLLWIFLPLVNLRF